MYSLVCILTGLLYTDYITVTYVTMCTAPKVDIY